MSKRSRDARARGRIRARVATGRASDEDIQLLIGWDRWKNREKMRSIDRWAKCQQSLLLTGEQFEYYVFFGMYKPLVKGKGY